MITLKMEKRPDNTSKPLELKVEDIVYKYEHQDGGPKEEFFKLLENYLNYKINVIWVTPEDEFIKEKSYIIKGVKRNLAGVMELELD